MAGRDCERFEPHLSALLDGELPTPAAATVEAHVRSCTTCAALARDLAGVSRILRVWDAGGVVAEPPAAVSTAFRSRVLAEVRRSGGGRRRPSSSAPASPPLRLLRWAPAAAAAAVVLTVAGVSSLLVPLPDPVPPSPGVVAPTGDGLVPTSSEFLAMAEAHRAAGRSDLERRAVLAAWGLAPGDAAVRTAFARSLGFDPAALDGAPDIRPVPVAPRAPVAAGGGDVAPVPEDEGRPNVYWAGPCRFSLIPAFDRFLDFRELSRELEIAQAARTAALPPKPVSVAVERAPAPPPHPLSRTLASLSVGAPVGGNGSVTWQGIVVYPLRARGGLPALPGEPLALKEALASGRAQVRDSRGRSAGTVLVTNGDPGRPLLVLAGEILEGGRADRMVARDVLVPAGEKRFPVPVYDVDVGRGSSHSLASRFRGVPGVAGTRLRGLAIAGASEEEIASFVRARLDGLFVTASRRSLTDAYSDRGPAAPVLRSVRPQVAALLEGLQGEDVVGFAVAQGPHLLAVELFGSHGLMIRHAPRVLEGAALESSTYAGGGRSPLPEDVEKMLEAAGHGTSFAGSAETFPEVGVLALEGGLLGSGIASGDAILHATVLRGAGSGALAGREARSGDLPGGVKPTAGTTSGESGGTPATEAGTEGDVSPPGRDDPSRPADGGTPARDRPK